jgi:hypothetical protein
MTVGRRAFSRSPNGRFRRATLRNTFGLEVLVCSVCLRMNPYQIGEPKPSECHACGSTQFDGDERP